MDYIFSNDPPLKYAGDVLKLTQLDYLELPDAVRSDIRFTLIQTADINSLSMLKRRVMEFVHYSSMQSLPLRLMDLNRRYARIASHFGTSATALLNELIKVGYLIDLGQGSNVILYSKQVYDAQLAGIIADGGTDFDLKDRLLSNVT